MNTWSYCEIHSELISGRLRWLGSGQRYTWINKNLSKFYPNVPESLLEFIPAFFCQEDCDRSPVEKPEWLDMDKYRKGQKFVQDYFLAINVTAPLALISFYTFRSLNAIILNGNSHTPCLAFKRYIYSCVVSSLRVTVNGEHCTIPCQNFNTMICKIVPYLYD